MFHTERTGSGVGIDMSLEKVYNKPAMGPDRVIGQQRRIEAEIDERRTLLFYKGRSRHDQMVMHLAHGCIAGITSALVYSPDTDVFVSML